MGSLLECGGWGLRSLVFAYCVLTHDEYEAGVKAQQLRLREYMQPRRRSTVIISADEEMCRRRREAFFEGGV